MAVTSVIVVGPPNTAVLFDTNLRPTMVIKLSGGTGPYDITWEWDTSSGFGSGNLVQAFDTGLTGDGPHSKAPGSDLGGAQTWYFRVLVTDTNDSNVYTHPPAGTHTLVYQAVDLTDSHLYHQSNVGVGFAADEADGDPKDNPSHLYHYHNVGVGFGPGLPDGDPKDFASFLYHYAYLEPTQPCPWIESMDPTLQGVGNSVTVIGDSFGAAQITWGGEIRLYDAPGYGGSYVTLTVLSWSDQLITFLIPSGATTGWVGVVHTTGTPTCTGSNQIPLTVVQTEADPETGWFLVAADPQNVNVEVINAQVQSALIKPTLNAIGSGRMNLPLGDPNIDQLIDPVGRVGTLIRAYTDGRFSYGFYAEKLRHEYNEEGTGFAIIEGRGMEAISTHMMVYPRDDPATPSAAPTWIYGSLENLIQNPGFDDAAEDGILRNPGGEDGNDDDGKVTGWSVFGEHNSQPTSTKRPTYEYEGERFITVDPAEQHSGISQTLSVKPNRRYHVRARIREETGTGTRITMALGGADDIGVAGTYVNNYKYENEIYGELDNVAKNGASPGCPGGATDGTWQVIDVEVQTGEEQTSLSIKIEDDTHPECVVSSHLPFWVDGVEIEGFGLGLDEWEAYDTSGHDTDSFRLLPEWTLDGSPFAVYLNLNKNGPGIQQKVSVTPNTEYTLRTNLRISGTTDTWVLSFVAADEVLVTAQAIYPSPPPLLWQPMELVYTTGPTETEIYVRLTYEGTFVTNPSGAWNDSWSLVPGEPASTGGKIVTDIVTAIQARGAGDFMQLSFDEDYDSAGRPWPAPLSLDIEPGESLYGVLQRLVALGHEWNIVPVNFAEGGDTGFELNLYTARSFDPNTGVGTNWSTDPEGPVIAPGDATVGGRIVKQVFNKTVVHAIGPDGSWSETYQEPYLGAGGYEESFGRLEDVIQAGASADSTTLAAFARARMTEEKEKETQVQVEMRHSSSLRPFLHFAVGDTLYVDLPPYLPDENHERVKRVRAISADLKDEGSQVTFRVDIDRVVYEDELGAYVTIAQLKERSPVENTGQGTGSVSSSGGSVITVGGSGGSQPSAPATHYHALDGTEITAKASSGDISGSLPGPITVNAVKGMPISAAIPAVTTPALPADVVWVYNRSSKIWLPTERNIPVMTLASIPLDTQRLKYNSANSGFEPEYDWRETTFSENGDVIAVLGSNRFYATEDRIIDSVRISLSAASTSLTTVDVNKGDVTIFTTQANRPQIAIAAVLSDWEIPDITAWNVDEYLTVDIDDGGNGANLEVYIKWRRA